MYLRITFMLLSIMISSCSRVDIAINWADTYLYYELKSQFDFSGVQNENTEKAADEFIASIKKEWLPIVAQQLRGIADRVESIPNDELKSYLRKESDGFGVHLKTLLMLAANQVPNLEKTITSKNWTYFKSKFEKKNSEILKDTVKNRMEENIELFMGPLSDSQSKLIQKWITDNPPNNLLRVENRRHIMSLLDAKLNPWSPEKWRQVVVEWAKNSDNFELTSYKEWRLKRISATLDLIEELFKSLSSKQKVILKKNLIDWSKKLSTS